MFSAKEVAQETCRTGISKVSKEDIKVLISAMFAGMFIGFGYFGYIVLASSTIDPMIGKFLGGIVFPVGIIIILLSGLDLFTGNCLITMGYMNKQYKIWKVINNLILVFIGNFLGALFFVFLLRYSNMLSDNGKAFVIKLSEVKVNLTFMEAIMRGILCNILVAASVYISYAAKDVTGKILALLVPILLFVVSGYEHSVANMFLLPMGYIIGGNYSIFDILVNNLLPVTLGNVIGGSIIIPLGYYFIYLKNKQ